MYTGPPELTVTTAVTSWTLDLPVLLVVLAAAGLYLAGVRQVRRAGQAWPVPRTVAVLAPRGAERPAAACRPAVPGARAAAVAADSRRAQARVLGAGGGAQPGRP